MIAIDTLTSPRTRTNPRLREAAVGFLYWLGFLLALEPGVAMQAAAERAHLAWDQEALRIAGASLLGATTTPLLFVLSRRFPITGERRWRNAQIHALATVVLAVILVVVSCLLADRLLASEHRPLARAIPEELANNTLLLVFVIAGFTGVAHAVRFTRRERASGQATESPSRRRRIAVPTRQGERLLDLDEVDWIETQGNYLALHAGTDTHLIRETAARLEAGLDPERFVRVHRRALVAVDRVTEIVALRGGDALLKLAGGAEVRLSRTYRQALKQRIQDWT